MKYSDEEVVSLFFRVSKVSKYSKLKKHELMPFLGQYRCLELLDKKGVLNQKELSNLLEIKPASISELLSKLEKKELIKREVDEFDKRIILVSLTAQGKDEIIKYYEKRRKAYSRMLSNFSDEEKEVFYNLLLKINSGSDESNE